MDSFYTITGEVVILAVPFLIVIILSYYYGREKDRATAAMLEAMTLILIGVTCVLLHISLLEIEFGAVAVYFETLLAKAG